MALYTLSLNPDKERNETSTAKRQKHPKQATSANGPNGQRQRRDIGLRSVKSTDFYLFEDDFHPVSKNITRVLYWL